MKTALAAGGQAPQVTEVRYDPGALTVGWAPMSASGLTGFRVLLKQEGGDTQHWDVGPNTYFYAISQTLDPAKTYTAAVATLINAEPGDQSAWLPVILLAPQMMSVTYELSPKVGLSLRWGAVQDSTVTGYTALLVEEGGGPTYSQSTSDTAAFFNQSLHVNRSYKTSVRATAQYGVVMGPASAQYEPVLVTPAVSALIYDTAPANQLTMRWGPVEDSKVTGFAATLREPGSVNTVNTDQLFAVFDKTLSVGQSYEASVRATSSYGVVQGPPSPSLKPIVVAPAVSSLIYDLSPAAVLTMRWGPVQDDQVGGYLAVLVESGGPTQTRTPTDTEATFEGALDSAKDYTAQVRATSRDGVIEGPASAPLSPITQVVALDLVDYDGTATHYSWRAATGPGIVKYLAVLSTVGVSPKTKLTDRTEAGFEGALPVNARSSAFLRGASANGVVLGPENSIPDLITAASSLTELDYDVGALTPSWTAVVQSPVTGYQIDVSNGGPPQTFDAGNVTTKTVAVTLSPADAWIVTVRPTGDRLIGPPALALHPIVKQPGLPALYYDGQAFPFSWLAVDDASVTGYVAEFYESGARKDEQDVATTEVSFPYAIEAGIIYGARVRPVGEKLKGPWTALAPGPFKMAQTITSDAYGRIKAVAINDTITLTYAIDPAGNVTDQTVAETPS